MHPPDHKKITDYVISNYSDCFSPGFSDLLNMKKTDIINGTEFEDMPFHGMGLKRAFHWHFYSTTGSKYPKEFRLIGLIRVHPTSKTIFSFHVEGFRKWISKSRMDKAMVTLGRIIHHIQDMSTPSHVTPIYHGPAFIPMPFSFPKAVDRFEKYSSDNIEKHLAGLPVKESIAKKDSESFLQIYSEAAENTLEYLGSAESEISALIDDKPVSVSTDIFWKRYAPGMEKNEKTKGFGIYGPFADYFGKDIAEENANGVKYSITFTDYIKIYDYCLEKMVSDTIRCLFYADSLLFPLKKFHWN